MNRYTYNPCSQCNSCQSNYTNGKTAYADLAGKSRTGDTNSPISFSNAKSFAKQQINRLNNLAGKDPSNSIDMDSFVSGMQSIAEQENNSAYAEQLQNTFKMFDTNGDGKMSTKELSQFIEDADKQDGQEGQVTIDDMVKTAENYKGKEKTNPMNAGPLECEKDTSAQKPENTGAQKTEATNESSEVADDKPDVDRQKVLDKISNGEKLSQEDIKALGGEDSKYTVVGVGAEGCAPCKAAASALSDPATQQALKDNGINATFIDVNELSDVPRQIGEIPNFMIYNNQSGEMMGSTVGWQGVSSITDSVEKFKK